MENTLTIRKPYKKLGFTYLDSAEIAVALKKVMANFQVHYFRLRNFHWNVEGPDFFELHEEFEKDYNKSKEYIDDIAERIRVFGIKPNLNMEDILSLSEVKEVKKDFTAMDMVREVLKDYEVIHESMLNALNAALETGDSATELLINKLISDLEKRNWMYTSWCK
ncbi:MAG: DNA starvation/stationary phase protection protein [Flavobacteriaceae bacterium]